MARKSRSCTACFAPDPNRRYHSRLIFPTWIAEAKTMNKTAVSLIGAPTDIGAGTPGSRMGPDALRVAGIAEAITQFGIDVRDCGNVSGPANPNLPAIDGFRHLPEGLRAHVQQKRNVYLYGRAAGRADDDGI